jgi:hypothetical protein
VGEQVTCGRSRTLILRWTGLRWLTTPSPNPGRTASKNELLGVTAISPFSAWAVGHSMGATATGARDGTLILNWDGESWRPVPGSQPGGQDRVLAAVGASSARDVWAVGGFEDGNDSRVLTVHCC